MPTKQSRRRSTRQARQGRRFWTQAEVDRVKELAKRFDPIFKPDAEFLKSRGWSESCLYDDRWNPPSVLDKRYRPNEGDPLVFDVQTAYELEVKVGGPPDPAAGVSE